MTGCYLFLNGICVAARRKEVWWWCNISRIYSQHQRIEEKKAGNLLSGNVFTEKLEAVSILEVSVVSWMDLEICYNFMIPVLRLKTGTLKRNPQQTRILRTHHMLGRDQRNYWHSRNECSAITRVPKFKHQESRKWNPGPVNILSLGLTFHFLDDSCITLEIHKEKGVPDRWTSEETPAANHMGSQPVAHKSIER